MLPIVSLGRRRRRRTAALLVAIAFGSSLALGACSPSARAMKLTPPVLPEKADFSTPEASVRTYLQYTSFAYRMVNSDLASAVAAPYEGVRVDSFIELNREKDRGIEQQLTSFAKRSESQEGTRVVLAAHEEWRYRYFKLSTKTYDTPTYTATYDTTYTLTRDAKGWLVDKYEAKALTPVH